LAWSEKSASTSYPGTERDLGIRLAAAMAPFWALSGHVREGRVWLTRFLTSERTGSAGPRARALLGAGRLALLQADYSTATAMFERSLAAGRDAGDARSQVLSLTYQATILNYRGELARATALAEESLAVARAIGGSPEIAFARSSQGFAAQMAGD